MTEFYVQFWSKIDDYVDQPNFASENLMHLKCENDSQLTEVYVQFWPKIDDCVDQSKCAFEELLHRKS